LGKLIFLPMRIAGGILAGTVSKKLFVSLWGLVDHEEPPKAEHRRINLGKLALALALEGAVFRLVKGLVDHGARQAFRTLTGSWPGEEAPDGRQGSSRRDGDDAS
jgi:hypothetical protein